MIGSWAAQVAVLAALKDAGVAGGRVFDRVPDGAAFPYVELGETQALPDDVQCRAGLIEFRSLHIWSRYAGQKELFEIASAIEATLHAKPLAVAGRDAAIVQVRELRTVADPDGKTQHGVLTLRIRHTENGET